MFVVSIVNTFYILWFLTFWQPSQSSQPWSGCSRYWKLRLCFIIMRNSQFSVSNNKRLPNISGSTTLTGKSQRSPPIYIKEPFSRGRTNDHWLFHVSESLGQNSRCHVITKFLYSHIAIKFLIQFITVFFAVVDGGLIALERGFVNPFQTFLLINWNTIPGHVKPADGKLCLGITAVGCQLVPESALRQVFFYAITVPIGCSAVLLILAVNT